MTPTMLKAMLTRWNTLPHLLSAGAQELRFLTSFIAVLFLVFLLFTMQIYTHHGQKSSTSNLKKTKLSLNSKKMKHRGLTPLFHFQENKSEKQGKMKHRGLTPLFHFQENKSKKQGKVKHRGLTPLFLTPLFHFQENKSEKQGKMKHRGLTPLFHFQKNKSEKAEKIKTKLNSKKMPSAFAPGIFHFLTSALFSAIA